MPEEETKEGMDRRDFLRKSAAAGALVAWATPVVQTIASRPAFAQGGTGPPCDQIFTIKIDAQTGQCEGGPNPTYFCLTPQGGNGCSHVASVTGGPGGMTVTLDSDCQVLQAQVKAAQVCCAGSPSGNSASFSPCPRPDKPPADISHVEMVFCCSSGAAPQGGSSPTRKVSG